MSSSKVLFDEVYGKCIKFMKMPHDQKDLGMLEDFYKKIKEYSSIDDEITSAALKAASHDIELDPNYQPCSIYWERSGISEIHLGVNRSQ